MHREEVYHLYDFVRSRVPGWQPGQVFDASIVNEYRQGVDIKAQSAKEITILVKPSTEPDTETIGMQFRISKANSVAGVLNFCPPDRGQSIE